MVVVEVVVLLLHLQVELVDLVVVVLKELLPELLQDILDLHNKVILVVTLVLVEVMVEEELVV